MIFNMILYKIQIIVLEMNEIWKNFWKKLLNIYNKENDTICLSFAWKYNYMSSFDWFGFYIKIL
jgi:hypothetical protein